MRRAAILLTSMLLACSSDPYGLEGHARSSTPPEPPAVAPPSPPLTAEGMFHSIERHLIGKCGGCHRDGAYKGTTPPPQFLAGDTYATLRAYPGVIVDDPYTSVLITKGGHAGPAISPAADKGLYDGVKGWLDAEALLLAAKSWPMTDPLTLKPGQNVVDLSKACGTGVTGVSLRFDASLVDGMLSLSNLTVITPAGPDVRIVHLRFHRVQKTDDDPRGTVDPADSFSDLNEVFPAGAETAVPPGLVLFGGASFRAFDLAADQIRVEAEKIEPGTMPVPVPDGP